MVTWARTGVVQVVRSGQIWTTLCNIYRKTLLPCVAVAKWHHLNSWKIVRKGKTYYESSCACDGRWGHEWVCV